MIPITELRYFVDTQPAYRILKPWWDVFTDYISIVMLMISVFGGTLQVTQDKMICLPCKWVDNQTCKKNNSTLSSPFFMEPKGIQYDLDRHQYNYVDAVCYENRLHWFAKYFPYLVLLHTLIFLACSNFWFKFPRTSSKLEHFVSILLKCFDSPWTTRALSETVVEESDPKPMKMNGSMDHKESVISEDVEASVPMLQKTKTRFEQGIVDRTETGVLDKKEGEQAKALFEKVKKFRIHVEEGDIVYRLYIRQTIIKVIKFILIICYTGYYVHDIKFSVDCSVNIESLTGYSVYRCAHPLATLFKILACFYISLVVVYGLICMYTLCWMLRRSLKKYSFESIREESSYSDIPDVKNDFAFMMHMIDQYDPLYSKRFAVFLSEVSENKLRQLNLNNEWTLDKLRQRITKNSQEKLELHLFMLSGIPDTGVRPDGARGPQTGAHPRRHHPPDHRPAGQPPGNVALSHPSQNRSPRLGFPAGEPEVAPHQVHRHQRDSAMDLQSEESQRASSDGEPQRGQQPLHRHRRAQGAQEAQSPPSEEQPHQATSGGHRRGLAPPEALHQQRGHQADGAQQPEEDGEPDGAGTDPLRPGAHPALHLQLAQRAGDRPEGQQPEDHRGDHQLPAPPSAGLP
ncbi:hypothetical protein fugu_003558 [Takifugu bimaculatus]|uniref:LRRC8 pannexin-like TM region domain-containing protein n=1 Tax=Takifugu bimaculatus TaxID=433685 RepID=A0A4Z2BA74_9TELE|nr:hypothetical protein fugu_003558 [Takifugu bimaculatus]